MNHWLRKNVAIAAAYFALAEFPALLFPGASPFWPPAALAALLALRWGWPAMPGVFFGSLLANLLASKLGLEGALIASVGNALAPMLGVHLFRRLGADPDRWWDEPRQVLAYLLAMGVVQSALSAAVGISGMLLGGSFPSGARVFTQWMGWLLGDASAVIMLAPLVQVLLYGRDASRSPRSRPVAANLAISLVAIVLVWGLAVFSDFIVPAEHTAFLGLLLFPLIWAVFALDLALTLALLAFTFTLLTFSAALGAPVVAAASSYEAVVALEFFMLAAGGAVIFAASLQRSRRLVMQRLEEQAATLEQLAMQRARSLVEQQAQFRGQLLRLSDMNAALAAINQVMAQAHDDSGLLQRFCDLVVELQGVASARIARPDDEGGFVALAGAAVAQDAAATIAAPAQALARRAWQDRQAVFAPPAAAPDGAGAAPASLPCAALALLRGGRPWALFLLELAVSEHFDQALQDVARQMASDISIGLDRIDAARREREQSGINSALLSNMSVGIAVMRYPQAAFEHLNQRMLQMLGATDRRQIQARAVAELFHTPEDDARARELVRRVLADGKAHLVDVSYRRLDGAVLVCDIAGTRLDFDDGAARILWTAIDVTERYQQAEKLRRVSAANAALLANTVVAIDMVRYPERTIVEVNQGFLDMFGFSSAEQVIGRTTGWLYAEGTQRQRMAQLARKILRDGSGSLSELAVRRGDGVTLYLDVHGRRLDGEAPQHPLIVWTSIDVSARRALTQELNRLAMFDALTNLPNRRATEQHIGEAVERARRRGTAVAVGMIDLDDFKPINDAFGHETGDRLLRELANRLGAAMRSTDFVGRLGGDEFVLVLEDLERGHDMRELESILARLGSVMDTPFELGDGREARLRMSLGLAFFPTHSDLPDTLLRAADACMYRVKGDKRERTQWWMVAPADPG